MKRLKTSGSSIIGHLAVPQLKRKALNSWSAVQDTFCSTKAIFERHRVVFTISTSIASIATAWAEHIQYPWCPKCNGKYKSRRENLLNNECYTLRHHHQSKVEERLDSIEKALKYGYDIEHNDLKELVGSGSCSTATCVAAAGTSLIMGYGLGWRCGKWYANRKFRGEQMQLLGQIKPKTLQLKSLRSSLTRPRLPEDAAKTSEPLQKDVPVVHESGDIKCNSSC